MPPSEAVYAILHIAAMVRLPCRITQGKRILISEQL
jgi:hypothetical protein